MSKKRKDPDYIIPNQTESYDPGRRTSLRSLNLCDCKICNKAKERGFFLHHKRKTKKKPGRPSTSVAPETFKICGNCFAKIYRGCNHSSEQCKRSRRTKIDGIVDITSPTSLQRAASRVNEHLISTPLGRPRQVIDVRKELFSADDVYGIGQDLQLSDFGIKTLIRDIRLATGSKKSVEKNTMQEVREKNHQLDDFFFLNSYVYRVKNKDSKKDENVERHTVLCNDVAGFIENILEKRDRDWGESILLRIGLDGGGGFFKIVLSIFDKNDPFPHVKSVTLKDIQRIRCEKSLYYRSCARHYRKLCKCEKTLDKFETPRTS